MAIQKIFVDYDLNKNKILNAKMHPITTVDRTAMSSTLNTSDEGLLVYDVDLNSLFIWRGDIWVSVTSNIQDIVAGEALSSSNINGIVTLDVNTDDSTIEVVNDAIQVKTSKQTEWDTAYNSRIVDIVGPLYFNNGYLGIQQAGGASSGYLWEVDYINFNNAANYRIVSGSVTGTTTKTLTLNRQSATPLQVSWTDDNTDAVLSVNGFTGAVVLNTDNIAEGAVNQYFTASRVRLALSAGAGISYDDTTGIISSTITQYTDAMARAVISAGTGISYDNLTGVITNTITQYTDALARQAISLTTNGTAGQATYTNGVFNIPNYTTDLTGYATEVYVNAAVANLVDSAPTTLDTLNELAAALGDDPNFATSITTLIGAKEPTIAPGTTSQYWRGDKTWQTLPIYDLSGYVPYNGATQAVNLGPYDLTVNGLTIGRGAGSQASNTAIGNGALSSTTGISNTAVGTNALLTSTSYNTAVGHNALLNKFNGNSNVAIGYRAGFTDQSGTGNIFIGAQADVADYNVYSNSIAIGNNAVITETNSTVIGNSSTVLSTIYGALKQTSVTSAMLKADAAGKLVAAIAGTDYLIPSSLSGYVPTSRTVTINGITYDLTTDRTWTIPGGLPAGGTAGQILSKVDATDYNAQWINEAPAASYTSQLKHVVKTGVAINKGQAVYVSSADGTNMIVSKASNASEQTSSKTLGLLETTTSTNGFANVITEGLLAGLDTTGANSEGDPVWLGTDGNLIYGLLNKPTAPAHLVFIGVVTRRNANNGEIFVKVQNGFEMDELHNVSAHNPDNNAILAYSTTTSLWEKSTIAAVLGYTPANAATYVPYTGATTDVNLGYRELSSSDIAIDGYSWGDGGAINFKQFSSLSMKGAGYTSIGANSTNILTFGFNQGGYDTKGFKFDVAGVTTNVWRTYTMPNASGTLALTSDIPTSLTYVDLTSAQTITGIKTFTNEQLFGNGITLQGGYITYTSGSYNLTLNTNILTANRNVFLQDGSGTLAFTSDIPSLSGYVQGSGTTNYLSKWTGGTSLGNSVAYDNGSALGINTSSPFESTAFKLDVNGGVIIKNTSGTTAQLILIDSNPATGGNNGFVQLTAGGNTGTAFGQWQTYYGTSIASGVLRLQPSGGNVLVGSSTAVTGGGMLQVAGDVNITGAFKINGVAISSGGVTSFNTRTGAVTLSSSDVTTALGFTPYNNTNPSGYITSYTETDTLATVTARGATTSSIVTFTSTTSNASVIVRNDGSGTSWRGRVGHFNATADKSVWFATYNGFAVVGAHNDALTAWADLLVNCVNNNGDGGTTRLSSSSFVGSNAIIHAGNYGSYALPLSGGTMSGTVTLKSISGTDQMVENTYGAYLHLGDWGVGRTATGAVLVNTAYRADYASDLFDMNISRFTNNSGYITSSSLSSYLPLSGGTTSGVVDFGPNSGNDRGIGIMYGSSGYGRIRFYQDGYHNHSTIHSMGSSWGAGYAGRINIDGQSGVTLGAWNDPDLSVNKNGQTYARGYRGIGNVAGTGEATYHPAGIYSTGTNWLYGTMYRNGTTMSGQGWMYIDWDYGMSVVGVYSASRYQGVWAMGDAYKLSQDGTSTGNLYGLAWSHPNAGGQAGYLTNHGLIHMMYGTAFATISDNIWCRNNITAYSDIRVKENIEIISNAMEKINAIRGVTFTRNDVDDKTQRHAGIIAQEVQAVLPEVISVNKSNGHLSVAYGNMVGLTIEGLKEHDVIINKQQEMINLLIDEIENLKQVINGITK